MADGRRWRLAVRLLVPSAAALDPGRGVKQDVTATDRAVIEVIDRGAPIGEPAPADPGAALGPRMPVP